MITVEQAVSVLGEPEVPDSYVWLFRSSEGFTRLKLCGDNLDESWFRTDKWHFDGAASYSDIEHISAALTGKQRITLKELYNYIGK